MRAARARDVRSSSSGEVSRPSLKAAEQPAAHLVALGVGGEQARHARRRPAPGGAATAGRPRRHWSRGGVVRHAHATQGRARVRARVRLLAEPREWAGAHRGCRLLMASTSAQSATAETHRRLPPGLDAARPPLRPGGHGLLERRRRARRSSAEDLGVSAGLAAWAISLYVLMLAVTTALYGRISDLVGVRAPLLAGLVLMSVGALVAALAPTFEVLLGARMLQGAGAAAVPTLGRRRSCPRSTPGEVRGLAFGRLAGVAAAVSCLGPLIGGVVEAAWGWRAVMALPILGALVVPLLWRALPTGGSGARLDVVGAIVVALTAAGMVLLVQSPSAGLLVAAIGATLLVLGVPAVARERTTPPRRLPAGRGDPQRDRRAQRRRRLSGARGVVRDAHRAAGGAARRGLGGVAGRAGHGAERRGRAARAAGHRTDADPHRGGSLAGDRRAGRVGGAAGRHRRRPLGERARAGRRHHPGDLRLRPRPAGPQRRRR